MGIFSTEDFRILYYRRYSRLSKPLSKNRSNCDKLQNGAADVENAPASVFPVACCGVSERTAIKWNNHLTFRRFPAACCRELQLLLYPYILDRSGLDVFVYYRAKKDSIHSNLVIVDCYDSRDRQIQGTRFRLGTDESSLYQGEVRRTKFVLPPGTKSFQFRLPGQ